MIEVILDTETTGLSAAQGHRIVEIGCIEINELVPTKKIFHYYLNPERKVSEEAFKVHGYSDEFLSKQKKFNDIAEEFLDFIKDKKFSLNELEIYLSKISDNALYSYNVYQIEGEGRSLFSKIEGDENTIMGLPIKKIKEYIKSIE